MTGLRHRFVPRGLTLVELMIVIAVVAVISMLAAPSFRDLILMQRLRGINAQIVTDMQFARAEAAARGLFVTVRVGPAGAGAWSCYTIFTDTNLPAGAVSTACDCLQPEAARCTPSPAVREIRTVIVPVAQQVRLSLSAGQPNRFAFDPVNGSIRLPMIDGAEPPPRDFVIGASIDGARALATAVGVAGRPTICSPAGSAMQEPACP